MSKLIGTMSCVKTFEPFMKIKTVTHFGFLHFFFSLAVRISIRYRKKPCDGGRKVFVWFCH